MEISHTIPKQPDESAQSHHKIPTTSMLEISHYVNCLAVDDKTKLLLMKNNKPPTGFQFPAKQYKDKQKKGGVMNRYCQEEWFRDFDFICLISLSCCIIIKKYTRQLFLSIIYSEP